MTVRILLDIDGVVANLVGALLEELRAHGFHRREKEVKHHDFVATFNREELKIIRAAMQRPGFVDGLLMYSGAQGFINELQAMGEVVALTKPYASSMTWVYERQLWCERRGIRNVVHTDRKHLVPGDCLIEDHPGNLCEWARAWPGRVGILLSRPWNICGGTLEFHQGESVACLATDYGAVLETVREMVIYPACGPR